MGPRERPHLISAQNAGAWIFRASFAIAFAHPLIRYCSLETTMLSLRRRLCFVLAVLAGSSQPAFATEISFPFGTALVLDATPLPGTKRLPTIEIEENGEASFYLWCASARGSANVGQDTISLTPTTALPSQCTPDQISRDADLLTELSQMTGWRRQGDEVDFTGTATLRFRLMTN
jgi:hypothetical protein